MCLFGKRKEKIDYKKMAQIHMNAVDRLFDARNAELREREKELERLRGLIDHSCEDCLHKKVCANKGYRVSKSFDWPIGCRYWIDEDLLKKMEELINENENDQSDSSEKA